MKFTILLILAAFTTTSFAQQKKEQDFDVNYDEELVPPYVLPRLLETAEGHTVTTPEEWMNIRRPQILSLFSHLIYGRVPVPAHPLEISNEVLDSDPNFLNGLATRQKVQLNFENVKGKAKMVILIFTPNQSSTPVPAFMHLNFDGPDSDKMQLDPEQVGKLRSGIPIKKILTQGFALVSVYQKDLIEHNEAEFRNTIHQLFFDVGQSFPKGHEWGVLATISWSASRVLDYLSEIGGIDANRVAIMGHSKLGKSTLWAAAQDQRFALAISIQSGCAGAALWRRKYGETLAKMSIFPHWLCTNARKFIHQEDDLPVDQHMLLALIAPRPVYVASAIDDHWADPRGEYLSAFHASEVYELFGKKGLVNKDSPPLNSPSINQEVGYHIRPGGHSVEDYDWDQFIRFANHHLK